MKVRILMSGLVLIALLAGCKAGTQGETQLSGAPAGPQAPVTIMTPGLAKERMDPMSFLDSVPPGFHALGGATFANGTAIVIAPDMEGLPDKHSSVGLMHGMWVTAHAQDPIEQTAARDCAGSGADHEHPIALSSDKGRGQIDDVLPCALARFPAATWRASQLIADDRHFYSVVLLQESSGDTHRVYADITPWAEDFMSQLK
jgi:hypothetical protein